MEIAVCDDNEIASRQLASMITEFLNQQNTEHHISVFDSADPLLKEIGDIHVVFLDIDMPAMDGIEAGKRIHAKNPDCKIIIETGFHDRYKDAFRAHAIRFVTKPFLASEIREALLAATADLIGEGSIFAFFQRQKYQIRQKAITYVHAYDGYVNIHTRNKIYRRDCSMKQMEQLLDDRLFFRIRQDYIINLSCIESYRNGVVALGDQTFPVAKRQKTCFESAFMNFDFEYRGRLT